MLKSRVGVKSFASLCIVAFVGLSACSSGEQTAADNEDPEEVSADEESTDTSTEDEASDEVDVKDDVASDPELAPDSPESVEDPAGPSVDAEPTQASPPEGEELEVSIDDDGNPEGEQFIGMEIEDAIDLADGNNVIWHVATIDGEKTLTTVPDGPHLSLELEQDKIISAVYTSS